MFTIQAEGYTDAKSSGFLFIFNKNFLLLLK